MANARAKKVDNTHLSVDLAEKKIWVHRDYIAHVFRWNHITRYMKSRLTRKSSAGPCNILDVGCGVDLPLGRAIFSNKMVPHKYMGVDYNPVPFHPMLTGNKFPLELWDEVDFLDPEINLESIGWQPEIITCLEMLEHVEPLHAYRVLLKILGLLANAKEPIVFLSTPCFDPVQGAANNHVNEMTYSAFGAMIEDAGFEITRVYGTFASQRDYMHHLFERYGESMKRLWDDLSEYYESNVLAVMFAPVFPQYSRNCIWKCRPATQGSSRSFATLADTREPWGSSSRAEWAKLVKFQEEYGIYQGFSNSPCHGAEG